MVAVLRALLRTTTMALAVSSASSFSIPARATTIAEASALPEPVYAAAIRLALNVEVYRLSEQDRKSQKDCLIFNFNEIRNLLKPLAVSEKAKTDASLRETIAEEIIAKEIRRACLTKGSDAGPGSVGDNYLPVIYFFNDFPSNVDKVTILYIAIGTQAALDLLNGEDERGKCAIANFLQGLKGPGLVELTSTLVAQRQSAQAIVEPLIVNIINKHCGPDVYDNFRKFGNTVESVLKEREAEIDRKIAEIEAKLKEDRRNAYRLPDGRAIYRSPPNNHWYFEDNTEVPENLATQRVKPPPGGWPD
jgi:hypothetical protein